MWILLLSVCFSIFSLEEASASEPYYAITVSAQMFYPSEERACITILKLKGELKLKMELMREQKSVLVTEDTINTPTYFHCYSFELPTVLDENEVWFFHVFAHGDNINIDQTKKIMLIKADHMTFIQTDKPNYKPGQTVSFRIVTLDRNYHAKNDKYPLVELKDPNKNRIGQWLDVLPYQGIADLSFPLANELPLGDYEINIPNAYRTSFTVSEPDEEKVLAAGLTFVPTTRCDPFLWIKDINLFLRKLKWKKHFVITDRIKCQQLGIPVESLNDVRLLAGLAEESDREIGEGPFSDLKPKSVRLPPLGECSNIDIFAKLVSAEISKINPRRGGSETNLGSLEREALLSLEKNRNIVIKPSDKGGNTVILDVRKYRDMCFSILHDSVTYEILRGDPTKDYAGKLLEILTQALDDMLISKSELDFMYPKHPRIATFYSLPKIHKGYVPLKGRPIVSGIEALCQNVSVYLDKLLRPFVTSLPSYIRDTADLIGKLEGICLEPGTILTSIDVEALYSSIPHEKGIEAVEYFLKSRGNHFGSHNILIIKLLRYTYGKPVSGSFQLYVCKETDESIFYFYLDRDKDIQMNDKTNFGDCQNVTGIHVKRNLQLKYMSTFYILKLILLEPNKIKSSLSFKLLKIHTDDKGCLSREIDLTFFNISGTNLRKPLIIVASLTEDISGDTVNAFTLAMVISGIKMMFENIPNFYQKGIPFTAELKVSEMTEPKPIVNEKVYLVLGFEEEDLNLTAVTNEEGIAVFTVDTSSWDDMVSLHGKFSLEDEEKDTSKHSYALTWLYPFYSESNSYLKVAANKSALSCDSDHYLTVEYFINPSQLDPADDQLHFFYFYVSKGAILSHGQHEVDIRGQPFGSVLRGKYNLKIPTGVEYYPGFIFVVHTILNNGDIPSYTKEFTTPLCLKNKVELKFSKQEVRPGEKVNLEVQAGSGSLCSVRSVDKGLLLHSKHAKYDENFKYMFQMMVYSVRVNKRGFPYTIEDFEKYPCLRNEKDPQTGIQEAPWYHGNADVYMMLKESNLKIFTNTKIRKPVTCNVPTITRRISNQPKKVELQGSPDSKSKEETKKPMKRIHFPETWLYELVSVGPQGHIALNLTTPHSITTWETEAFCLGSSGFGKADAVGLATFQPYFIELISPYSVVQGEEFTITAHVFNYLKSCIMVFVSLSDLENNLSVRNKDQSKCVCEDPFATFTWNLSASEPGKIKFSVRSTAQELEGGCTDYVQTERKDQKEDIVEKSILIKPSGVLEEKAQTFLLCPSGDSVRRTVTLEVPEKMVPDADHAHISVFGNLLGNVMYNIGEGMKLPSGSGEQNMMTFIPLSHIVKYLEATKKLTPKIKEKAIIYLTQGYLRQLMFKKDDGSYSLFHGMNGSTWLTAFTLRSFSHAQDLIYIQEKHFEDAVKWLSTLQLPTGCFKEVGKIFNNYLMRESDDNVTLTGYITIALLEHGQVHNVSVVENALKCLKNAADDVKTTYTQALLAYVFTLSSDSHLRNRILEILDKAAIIKGESKYWAADGNDNGDIEISSYVLLALLSHEASDRDVEEAYSIVNWIFKGQSPYGGFRSTQDTAVAVQALTKYAKITYKDDPDVTVTVKSLSGFHRQFHVDSKNSLLLQSETLPDIPGEYTLTATGTGCAYIQTHLKYYTPLIKSDSFFIITASTEPSVCTNEAKTKLDILVEVRYSGKRTEANAVIIEVQVLSGFLPIKRSVKKLKDNPIVERTEIRPDKVMIHMAKLTHEVEHFRFSIKQELNISNLQPAKVKICDCYAPDLHSLQILSPLRYNGGIQQTSGGLYTMVKEKDH
ncbi:alpha-2-macroglobulin-like protein 1 [Anomaloglossus baeobatrachus]